MIKKCPFSQGDCTPECSLFVATEDLNELVAARLTSLGVVDKTLTGSCSFKILAMSGGRYIFENTATKRL